MTIPKFRGCASFALLLAAFAVTSTVSAQTPPPHPVAATRTPTTTNAQELAKERDQLWNSADMLRARAWLKDYCSKSAKVTPEMAQQYETELQNMSPNQMRLWLMKFDAEEQERQQQYAMFQQANQAGLQQAMAAHRQTQQAYSAINRAESAAAQNAQQQITEQRENAQQNADDRALYQSPNPYGYGYGYGVGPYGGPIQYHFHMYQ